MALSGNSMDELIKPELREEWESVKHQWFPRNDTEENIAHDLRTPGLFKKEWSGDGFIGLASKTYFCFKNDDTSKNKCSSKGINKSINLSKSQFMNVLKTKEASSHRNKGFIMKDKFMYTYEMERLGLPYVYYKRKVLDDGVSTTYLDI